MYLQTTRPIINNTMHHDHTFNNAVKQLAQRNNINISMVHGASVLTADNGKEIWLEAPIDRALVIVHTAIREKINFEKQNSFWEKCLEVNANIEALQGGWLCKHEQTNTLRLCYSLPKKFIDLSVLDDTLKNITELSNQFEANFLK